MNTPPYFARQAERGVSLLMVLLVMVLVTLTALSASRSSFFNESVTSNEADYNRALSAAESLIRDAQLDINGMASDGVSCNWGANFEGCRPSATGTPTLAEPFFPSDLVLGTAQSSALQTALNNVCVAGICAPNPWPANALPPNFWLTPATLQSYVNGANGTAATYGQFTRQVPGATGNPILTAANPARAWYWVELIDFAVTSCAAVPAQCVNRPIAKLPFIYRITAVARGQRANTMAVIQTYYVPYPI
ncbi:MAG: hypothetical protein KAY82_01600 [Hylemonella sp.]|nr:hypothetical protein [Hylemonella sp.]